MKKYLSESNFAKKFLMFCLVFMLPLSFLTGCGGPSVTITVAGKEVKIKGTVQECIDNGLITTDTSGNKLELTQTLGAREASFQSIRLGNSDWPRKCPVTVSCYNPTSSKKSIYDCSIMIFTYNLEFDSADQVQVLINGIDFWGKTEKEAVEALADQGIKIDADRFYEKHYISFDSGKVRWKLESEKGSYFNKESDTPLKEVVDFEDETYYISSVSLDITNTLNLKSK